MMHPTWWTQQSQAVENEIRKVLYPKKVLDFFKLEYYKEFLDFRNIEYHIVFLISQISSQQCHASEH